MPDHKLVEIMQIQQRCPFCGKFYWVESAPSWCPYGCLPIVLARPEGQLGRIRDFLFESNLVAGTPQGNVADCTLVLLAELAALKLAKGSSG